MQWDHRCWRDANSSVLKRRPTERGGDLPKPHHDLSGVQRSRTVEVALEAFIQFKARMPMAVCASPNARGRHIRAVA